MSQEVPYNVLLDKLQEYKKKYYLNLLLKGSIFFLLTISVAFIFFTYIEYFIRLSSQLRLVLLISFIGLSLYSLVAWIIIPLYKISHLNDYLSDSEAAIQLGKYFPEIADKLLNTIQLRNVTTGNQELIYASISQKTKELAFVPFIDAVKIDGNKKYLKYASIPLLIMLVTLFFIPKLFLESSARIINYNKEFPIPAPFRFILSKDNYKAFKNEDFNVDLLLDGQALPDNVYLISQNGFK
ncbi:MAG TPA: ATPase, partial [Cytophagaceae bacterium]